MPMLKLLRRPLPLDAALVAAATLVAAVTLYCLAYTSLAGRPESPIDAIVWAVVNILPWFMAFEAAKRTEGLLPRLLILAGACAASLLLQLVPGGGGFGHELVRRIPGLLLVAALLWMLPEEDEVARGSAPGEWPLPPSQIDWVSAAGNYIELHARGRTLIRRASLSSVAAELAPQGFVRIHRSTLVRRDAIARIRAVDVVLHDGTSLKLGDRYRSSLDPGGQEFRPFVPAE